MTDNETTSNGINYAEVMASSDRVSGGFSPYNYLNMENLEKAVADYRMLRNEGNSSKVLKLLVKKCVKEYKLLLSLPMDIEVTSHFNHLKTFLGKHFVDEYGVKIYFSKGEGTIQNPDWLKFQDEWYEPDASLGNPKGLLALEKSRLEKKIEKVSGGLDNYLPELPEDMDANKKAEITKDAKKKLADDKKALPATEKRLTEVLKELAKFEENKPKENKTE